MKYLITTKQEWDDEVTSLGSVFNTLEEAIERGREDYGVSLSELLVIPIDKVMEVDQKITCVEYKGEVK